MYLYFLSFLNPQMAQVDEIIKGGEQESTHPTYLYSQYHGCWCPGDGRSQDISSRGIGLVPAEYCNVSPNTKCRFRIHRTQTLSSMYVQMSELPPDSAGPPTGTVLA